MKLQFSVCDHYVCWTHSKHHHYRYIQILNILLKQVFVQMLLNFNYIDLMKKWYHLLKILIILILHARNNKIVIKVCWT